MHVRGSGNEHVIVEPPQRLEHDTLPPRQPRWGPSACSPRASIASRTAACSSPGSTALLSPAITTAGGSRSAVRRPSV